MSKASKKAFREKLASLGYDTYRQYLLSDHWSDVKRRYRKSKLAWKCFVCGDKEKLQLHHKTYKRLGEEHLRDLIPLCQPCHAEVHRMAELSPLWTAASRLRKGKGRYLARKRAQERKRRKKDI